MNDAEALAGRELRVPVERLAPLPAGTFYRHDLVGCRVETRDGRTVGIGRRRRRDARAAAGWWCDGDGGEVLIPLVAEICTAIDPAAKRIVIDPPDGLLELNRGTRRPERPAEP